MSSIYTVIIEELSGNQISYQLTNWPKAWNLLTSFSKEKPYKKAIIKDGDREIISLKTL